MRRLTLLTVALIGIVVSPALTTPVNACVRQPGDLRLINRAIDAKSTPKAQKAELRRLRAVMLANRGAAPQQIARYQAASRKGLDLIGETTVVPHDASAAQAGATKSAFVGC